MGLIVFSETLVLILFMLIGAFMEKTKRFTPSVSLFVGSLLTSFALPAAIINSFQVEKTRVVVETMIKTLGYSVIMLILTIGFAYGLATLLKKKGILKRLWVNCLLFSNILFIGMPIVSRLYGEIGLIVLVIYNTVISFALFTIGVMIFSNSKELKIRSIVTTPAIVAAFIGILLFGLGIQLPQTLRTFNGVLGGMTAPLAMIVNGALFVRTPFMEMIRDKDNIEFTIARVIGVPILFVFILQGLIKDPVILGVLTLVTAMPTGSLNAILAEEYAGEGKKVSQYIAMTTIVSMVTLPLIMSLLTMK